MDISKLPILIANPAEQVRKNALKIKNSSKPGVLTWDMYTEMRETINHLTELKKDKENIFKNIEEKLFYLNKKRA